MQRMGLEGLKLNWGTKQAIRSLGYSASCKIGGRMLLDPQARHRRRWSVQDGPAYPLLRLPILQHARPPPPLGVTSLACCSCPTRGHRKPSGSGP